MASALVGLAVLMLLFAVLALFADMHERALRKAERDGWRKRRAYLDSLEPQQGERS